MLEEWIVDQLYLYHQLPPTIDGFMLDPDRIDEQEIAEAHAALGEDVVAKISADLADSLGHVAQSCNHAAQLLNHVAQGIDRVVQALSNAVLSLDDVACRFDHAGLSADLRQLSLLLYHYRCEILYLPKFAESSNCCDHRSGEITG